MITDLRECPDRPEWTTQSILGRLVFTFALLFALPASAGPLCDRAVANEYGNTSTPAPEWALRTCHSVSEAARVYGVRATLALAVSSHESRFMPFVVSSAGAAGAMQVKPHYHCRTLFGWRACLTSRQLIRAGVRHLADLLRAYDETTALRAYNAGVRGATRLGRGHGYAEAVARGEGRICGGT